jgi:hypothetical protein
MSGVADGVVGALLSGRYYLFFVYFFTFSFLIWLAGRLEHKRVVPRRRRSQVSRSLRPFAGHPSPTR